MSERAKCNRSFLFRREWVCAGQMCPTTNPKKARVLDQARTQSVGTIFSGARSRRVQQRRSPLARLEPQHACLRLAVTTLWPLEAEAFTRVSFRYEHAPANQNAQYDLGLRPAGDRGSQDRVSPGEKRNTWHPSWQCTKHVPVFRVSPPHPVPDLVTSTPVHRANLTHARTQFSVSRNRSALLLHV